MRAYLIVYLPPLTHMVPQMNQRPYNLVLQWKRSGCCHFWWLLGFGLVVVVPISIDFFFILFLFALRIRNFSLKLRPVRCSPSRAAAAHRVSWRSDTNLNCAAQPHTLRSDTNQPSTVHYATQRHAVGPGMLMTWDPFDAQTRRVLTQRLWDLVWISDWNKCKAERYIKLEVPVVSLYRRTCGMPPVQSKSSVRNQLPYNIALTHKSSICAPL